MPLLDRSKCIINRIEIVSDQDEVEVVEAAEFEEALPPIESFLDFGLAEFFIVDCDELVDEL